MTLAISLRRPFSIPRVFQTRKDEPQQDYHWVGQKPDTEQQSIASGHGNRNPQDNKSEQKYRSLANIKLGEVDDVYQRFEYQLLLPQENWIRKNHFCQIPLKRKQGYPPMIFGWVKTCYPSDGVLDNVDEIELYFPHPGSMPDVLHIRKNDISRKAQTQAQCYFVRVRVLASTEEQAKLVEAESLLSVNGFYPEFESGYLDLLEMSEQNQSTYPWLYVVGSRWFESIPDSLREEVKGKLKEMIGWGKKIFNYHPEWLTNEANTLNRTLGYKYGFTNVVLAEPGNAEELAFIVDKTFKQLVFLDAA